MTSQGWGAGMIYYHVWLLNKNNIDAYVLHDKKPFSLSWLKLGVQFCYLNDKRTKLNEKEILVIPEYYVDLPQLVAIKCRKIVFVQNAFYIFDGLKNGKSYEELGIEKVFYYMPHLKKVLGLITPLPLYETPPFIAPYFYLNGAINLRKRRILIYPKFDNRDYIILKRILEAKLGLIEKRTFAKFFSNKNDWKLIELKNKKHNEVAEEMKEAAFFICLNTTEAFNSSVPEAMAAGCINICYEGVGPADFLENNKNAFVFSNNHIYSLVEKVIDLLNNYDNILDQLNTVRNNANETANTFTINKLETQLVNFFRNENGVHRNNLKVVTEVI